MTNDYLHVQEMSVTACDACMRENSLIMATTEVLGSQLRRYNGYAKTHGIRRANPMITVALDFMLICKSQTRYKG